MSLRVGVLGLQGAVEPHLKTLAACGAEGRLVRLPEELADTDALILPGGESTTMGKLMARYGLDEAIRDHAYEGEPIFGTCAGMILLAKDILDGESGQPSLALMDITVRRNSFGRQVDSFESPLEIPSVGAEPFPGVFIRAPHIESVGAEVEVLGCFGERIVFARQGNLLAASFHPELTGDTRIHRFFLELAG